MGVEGWGWVSVILYLFEWSRSRVLCELLDAVFFASTSCPSGSWGPGYHLVSSKLSVVFLSRVILLAVSRGLAISAGLQTLLF